MNHSIDLSMLTSDEIKQIKQNISVVSKGKTSVALYMRYSSNAQSEQSIEGQLRDALAYCKTHDFKITAIYVDRALSASKEVEKRVNFMQMISDSSKKLWQYVVVWKLDRFARSRTDSAIYKAKLKQNGVKVVSVTENISENPEGIILEAVLEGMAEFYSAELSQKITRGLRESALKCNVLGGQIPLGYKVEGKKFIIDPVTAPVVREAFQKYADGWMIAEIYRNFNERGLRTSTGALFNRNSFKAILRNKRYIGVYKWGDIEIEDGMPAIIDKDLFEAVQLKLHKNKEVNARGKANVEYLLSGKIFCGHCGDAMIGDCGKSHTGAVHYYYTCGKRKRRQGCDKKSMRKEVIERWVAEDALAMLTDEVIEQIADVAVQQTEEEIAQHTRLPELTKKLNEITGQIANFVKAIEDGIISETVVTRVNDLEKQKQGLEEEIKKESALVFKLDKYQVIYWLEQFKGGDIEDDDFKRQLVDLLINSVTVWDMPDGDFKITTAYNLTSCKTASFMASERFGYEARQSTIKSISEPYILGTICFIQQRHSLR